MFMVWQLVMPILAYALPPIWIAAGISAAAHVGAAWYLSLQDVGLKNSGGGGTTVRLDGKTGATVPGWTKDSTGAAVPPSTNSGTSTFYKYSVCTNGWYGCQYATDSTLSDVEKAVCQSQGYNWGGGINCYNGSGNNARLQVTTINQTVVSCPAGYTVSGTSCALSDATKVQKPANTPCEAIFKNNGFIWDPNNPACAGVQKQDRDGCQQEVSSGVFKLTCVGSDVNVMNSGVQYKTPYNQATIPFADFNGGKALVIPSDKPFQFPGGFQPITFIGMGYACDNDGYCKPNSNTASTSTVSPSDGSLTSQSQPVSNSGNTGVSNDVGSVPVNASSTVTVNNNYTFDASSALGVNDSGFQGTAGQADGFRQGAEGSDNAAIKNLKETTGTQVDSFASSLSHLWVPKPKFNQACEPFNFNWGAITFNWNWCPYLSKLQNYVGYMFYIFTGLYLFRKFTESAKD